MSETTYKENKFRYMETLVELSEAGLTLLERGESAETIVAELIRTVTSPNMEWMLDFAVQLCDANEGGRMKDTYEELMNVKLLDSPVKGDKRHTMYVLVSRVIGLCVEARGMLNGI